MHYLFVATKAHKDHALPSMSVIIIINGYREYKRSITIIKKDNNKKAIILTNKIYKQPKTSNRVCLHTVIMLLLSAVQQIITSVVPHDYMIN